MTQGLLLGVTGTHLEPTGADARGPEIEVCDSCRIWVEWSAGFSCTTPEVHHPKDPGMDPEEGDEDVSENSTEGTVEITERLADEIAAQVDVCLALAGEGGDDPAALRAAIDGELGHGDFARWPEKRGKQVEFVEQLARVVSEKLGTAGPEEVKRGPTVVREGFDVESQGQPIIRTPIGE